jgi:hypothetical protein
VSRAEGRELTAAAPAPTTADKPETRPRRLHARARVPAVRERLRVTRGDGERPSGGVYLAFLVASLATALLVLVLAGRRLWFHGDDFDFLVDRGLHGAARSIWAPHNEHWSTIPILIWRALFSLFGMQSAMPYLVVLFVAHLALSYVLWRAMCQMGAHPLVATLLAALFALFGAGGANTILWEFQIGFVLSLLLGWIFVLLVNHEGPLGGRDVLAEVIGILGLMTSGVAVTMVLVAGLVALFRRGWAAAGIVVGPPALVYLVWYVLAGHSGVRGTGLSWVHLVGSIPVFVFFGLSHSFSALTGSIALAVILLLVVALWVAKRPWRRRRDVAPALMALVGCVAFLFYTAVVRAHLGVEEAGSARYWYVVAALALPAVGLAVSQFVRGRRVLAVLAFVALVVAATADFGNFQSARNGYETAGRRSEMELVAGARLESRGPTVPGGQLFDTISLGQLRQLARAGELPKGVQPTPVAVVDAALAIQLGMTSSPSFPAAGAVLFQETKGVVVSATPLGCETASPVRSLARIHLVVSSPSSLRVTSNDAGKLVARLFLGRALGVPRKLVLARGTMWLDVAASPSHLELTVPTGTTLSSC